MTTKHILQFVDQETGIRSEAFSINLDELRRALTEQIKTFPAKGKDYILINCTMINYQQPDEELVFPRAPLISINAFLGIDQEEAANG